MDICQTIRGRTMEPATTTITIMMMTAIFSPVTTGKMDIITLTHCIMTSIIIPKAAKVARKAFRLDVLKYDCMTDLRWMLSPPPPKKPYFL